MAVPEPQQLDSEEHAPERAECEDEGRDAQYVPRRSMPEEGNDGAGGGEPEAQQPARGPQPGDDAAGDRDLSGDHGPAARRRASPGQPIGLAQRHREGAQQVKHPADAGPGQADCHRQCPFSYTRNERPSSSSAQTARRKNTALTVRSTKNAGMLATARRTSPRRAAPAITGMSTAGASIT